MMDTAKEILTKVKAMFFGEPVVAPAAPVAPTEPVAIQAGKAYKTKDGKEVIVSQAGEIPATGDTVTIDGMPAGEGEYELEDGSKITVDAMGMVTVFTPGEPVTNELNQETPVAPTMEQRIASIEQAISRLSAPVAPAGMATEVQLNAATQTIDKHEKTITGLFELVEKLTELPTANPVTLTGNKKERFDRTQKKEDDLQKIADAIKEMKAGK